MPQDVQDREFIVPGVFEEWPLEACPSHPPITRSPHRTQTSLSGILFTTLNTDGDLRCSDRNPDSPLQPDPVSQHRHLSNLPIYSALKPTLGTSDLQALWPINTCGRNLTTGPSSPLLRRQVQD